MKKKEHPNIFSCLSESIENPAVKFTWSRTSERWFTFKEFREDHPQFFILLERYKGPFYTIEGEMIDEPIRITKENWMEYWGKIVYFVSEDGSVVNNFLTGYTGFDKIITGYDEFIAERECVWAENPGKWLAQKQELEGE